MNDQAPARGLGGSAKLTPSTAQAPSEVGALRAHAEALAEGQGALVMYFGPRGSGKTRLLHQALTIATEAVPHVRTMHVPGDSLRSSSLAGVAGMLVHALDLPTSADTELVEEVLRSGEVRKISDSELLRAAANIGRVATASRPILVLIDDLPYFALNDISALSYLAARISELPLLIVATSSFPLPPDKSSGAFGPLWMRRLNPIGPAEAWNIARTYGTGFIPPVTASTIADLGGGLPADIVEIVRSLEPAQLRGVAPMPETISLSAPTLAEARDWLSSLDEKHRLLLIGAALTPFGNRDDIEAAFDAALEDAGVDDQDRWFESNQERFNWTEQHRRVAVLSVAPRRNVLAVHRALAEYAQPGSVERAWHTLRMGSTLDEGGFEALTRAARAEISEGDLRLGFFLANEALKSVSDQNQRIQLTYIRGIAALHLGYIETAFDDFNACRDASESPEMIADSVIGIVLTVAARDGSLPTTLIDAAITQLRDDHPHLALHVAALAARCGFTPVSPSEVNKPRQVTLPLDLPHREFACRYLDLAAEIAEQVTDPAALAGLEFSRIFHGHGDTRDAARLPGPLVTEHSRFDLTAWDRAICKIVSLTARGSFGEAPLAVAETSLLLQRTPSPYFAARTASAEMACHIEAGGFQNAATIAYDSMFSLPLHLAGPGLGILQVTLIFTVIGDQARAEQWTTAARLACHAYPGPLLRTWVPALLSIRAEIAGDVQAAAEQAANAARHLRDIGAPAWHRIFVNRAEQMYLAGQDQTDSPELARIEEAVAELDSPCPTARANLAAARTLMCPVSEVLGNAVETSQLAGELSPFQRARTLLTALRALQRISPDQYQVQAKQFTDPVIRDRSAFLGMLVSRAVAAADESGAVALTPLIRQMAGALPAAQRSSRGYTNSTFGNGDASGEELTAEEHIVAQMVAAGATNKQVAAALFVSVRTIELRLTSIYRKLGLNSRKELPRAMAALEANAAPAAKHPPRSPEAFNAAFD